MRILVCGGRDYDNRTNVYCQLDLLKDRHGEIIVIHGCARGADSLAEDWASSRRVPCHRFPAEWDKHGKAAGPIRNKQMIDEGKPEFFIAFPGGKGTANMVGQLLKAAIPGKVFSK